MKRFDHIVVGHGIAGAALAAELTRRDKRVLVIDREDPSTPSRVAAGLMTPITGKRMALTPRWSEYWSCAIRFYRRLEQESGQTLLHRGPMVRLFSDEEERSRFESRKEMLGPLIAPDPPSVDSRWFSTPWGGFEMPDAGRLDVGRFLQSRHADDNVESLRGTVDLQHMVADEHGVTIRQFDVTAGRLTLCTGPPGPESDPWFPNIEFEPATGEMLTVRVPGLTECRTIHCSGLWLTPIAPSLYRVGATYGWNDRAVPTEAGREELLARLSRFLKLPVEVVKHDAATRPIVRGRQPVVGIHQRYPCLSYINGLGSKGALVAPWLATMLAGFLDGANSLDADTDLRARFGPPGSSP